MNKSLKIASVKLIVSANDRSVNGWLAMLQIEGMFPGCRKAVRISTTPMDGYIWFHPLNGYAGSAKVSPADWSRIMDKVEVVTDRLFPILITPEMELLSLHKYKVEYLDSMQNKLDGCNDHRASRNLSGFQPEFDIVEFI